MTTHRTTPKVIGGFVHEYNGAKVGSPEWILWLAGQRLFSFYCSYTHDGMTVRRERMKRGDTYWYAYRKIGGKLHKIYLGKDETLTDDALLNAARRLADHSTIGKG